MKLREYMELLDSGYELTCWDKDVDSEFYFYTKEAGEDSLYDDEFPNLNKCIDTLIDILDVTKIHNDGVEVNLYDVLDNTVIIQYAKDNFYESYQYEDDSDVVMLLFNDNVINISQGYEVFSEQMVKCLNAAYGIEKEIEQENKMDFLDDKEKMRDFHKLTKEEFLASYSYLTEEEYDATQKKVDEQKDAFSVEDVLNKAKGKSEEVNSSKAKNEYFKVEGDGWFDYYVNKQTGEKKFELEENDILVDRKLDDFVRE